MANTNLTIDMITKETLRVAHEKLAFLGTIDRSYDDAYAKGGAKIGDVLRVRLPNQFSRRTGSRVMDVQDVTSEKLDVTVATQDGVDMRFNSAELALDIDEFSKRYIDPAVSSLISGIESDCLATATKGANHLVGTAGTVVGSSSGDVSAIFDARAKLNQFLAPKEGRAMQIDSVTMAAIVNGNKGLFNPQTDSAKAFREGYFGRAAGFDWYENERAYMHTVGSDVTAATAADATITDGGGSGTTCTITWDGSNNIKAGDVFTLPKVYAVHPETKANTKVLMQFVATEDSTGTTTVISPRVYWSGPKQNVCAASGIACVAGDFDSETATFVGTASTAYRRNLAYAKDFATFVTADLPLMGGAEKCSRLSKEGLSIRVWQDADIRNDELLTRMDILYGFKVLRPEWGVQITN